MSFTALAHISRVEIVMAGGVVLLAIPMLVFPVVVLMNFLHHRNSSYDTVSDDTNLNFEQIEKIISDKNSPKERFVKAIENYASHYTKLPDDKNSGASKERFAHHLVMINYLTQNNNTTKEHIEKVGYALINENPVYRKDFEKKVGQALQKFN